MNFPLLTHPELQTILSRGEGQFSSSSSLRIPADADQ